MRSNEALAQAMTFKEHTQTFEARLENRTAQDRQPLRQSSDHDVAQEPAAPAPVSAAPVRFLKGKLVSVDCSPTPQALLTVAAGAKSVRLHVRDSAHVILLGADAFSCDWKGKSVAVNYRERPDGDGDVVSVEIQ